MDSRRKLSALVVLGIAVMALVALSAGLSSLELLPGQPLSVVGEPGGVVGPDAGPGGETLLTILWKVLSILFVVLLPFSIIRFILSPQMRTRVLRDMGYLILLLGFNYLLARALQQSGVLGNILSAPAAPASDAAARAAAGDLLGNPPEWLAFPVSLGLILVLVGLAWLVWRRIRRTPSPLKELAREAQEAIHDLHAGGEVKNVIARCYVEMCQVLSDRRGIRRHSAMTPREFEVRLMGAGLPRDAVLRLTRLFETVRYGAAIPGEREEREAVACLTAILEACASLA